MELCKTHFLASSMLSLPSFGPINGYQRKQIQSERAKGKDIEGRTANIAESMQAIEKSTDSLRQVFLLIFSLLRNIPHPACPPPQLAEAKDERTAVLAWS